MEKSISLKSSKSNKTYTDIFQIVDEKHKITPADFVEDAGLPFGLSDNYHVCLWGKSRCGKSTIISQLMA